MASSDSPAVAAEPPAKRRKISPPPSTFKPTTTPSSEGHSRESSMDPAEDQPRTVLPDPKLQAEDRHARPPMDQSESQVQPVQSDIADPSGHAEHRASMAQGKIQTDTIVSGTGFQPEREEVVGILRFVNTSNPGFSGILKQRYTDFLVNEITLDGNVVHLTKYKVPSSKVITKEVSQEARSILGSREALTGNENMKNSTPNGALKQKETSLSEANEKKLVEADGSTLATSSSKVHDDEEMTKDDANVSFVVCSADRKLLEEYFGAKFAEEVVELHERILAKSGAKPATFGALLSEPIKDRPRRGHIHQNIRRIFDSRLETESVDGGAIKIYAAAKLAKANSGSRNIASSDNQSRAQKQRYQPRGKLGWQDLGGEYLHFTLYKENKDTMEIITFLSRQLKVKPKEFSFAGTKDRRAVTVQRVSVFRQHAQEIARLSRTLRGSRIGDFKYEKHQLELGELEGNQFHITLRDCHFGADADLGGPARAQLANDVVGQAIEHLKGHGFINYFGLQRFGTFGVGTDEVGAKILRGDFEGAVSAILTYGDESIKVALVQDVRMMSDKISRDDIDRAHGIYLFKKTGKAHAALEKLPRKFSAEAALIRHLSSENTKNDYVGGLLKISRHMRTMYVHAYQSLVWNMVASERWARYGSTVVKGDLVLIDSNAQKAAANQDQVDENGEIVLHPAADDVAMSHDDLFQRARPLTADEAESGTYKIFDVVLPTPGFDIEYPDNDIGDYYKDFMGSARGGGLDPADMRRRQKDFSLSGSYRKVLAKVGTNLSFEVKIYHEENEQLVETDLQRLQKSGAEENNNGNDHGRRGNGYFNKENQRPQNNRGSGSGHRRGGRQNHNFYNMPTRKETPSEERIPQESTNDSINAWQNLPEKLADEDKAAVDAEKFIARLDPRDIKQPIYKDTFIETSAEIDGRRTGYRSTKLLSSDGNEEDIQKDTPSTVITDVDAENHLDATTQVSKESAISTTTSHPLEPVAQESLKLGQMSTDHRNRSFASNISLDATSDGGVKLSVQPTADTSPSISATEEDSLTTPHEPRIPTTSTDSTHNDASELGNSENSTANANQGAVAENTKPAKIAVVVKFDLGSSQYATMALRELMKAGGVKTYKPDFSGGRA